MNDRTVFVENVSRQDVKQGWHIDPTVTPTVLIQISDCGYDQPTAKYGDAFVETRRFWFDDTEDLFDMNCVSDYQAKQLAGILTDAFEKRRNVVVHCHAGICRSGAVAEVGQMIGFVVPEGRNRIPNSLVKRKMMEALGISFNPEKSPFDTVDPNDEKWDN